jgi:hypothetical protein
MTPRFSLAIAAFAAAVCAPIAGMAAGPAASATQLAEGDSCVACHRDPRFLVTNPKLYDYYRDWDRSIHRAEGVGCAGCHGGNPRATEKDASHAASFGDGRKPSAVNFAKVPETCGSCHERIRDAYLESSHYAFLVEDEEEEAEEKQGPNCVTCHRAMNTLILDVTTVEKTCSQCHNTETENEPDMPERARRALNKFLSIDRFHRYVAVRLEPPESEAFLGQIDGRIDALAVRWHTFDLEKIDELTAEILDALRAKRDEIRARKPSREAGAAPRDAGTDDASAP